MSVSRHGSVWLPWLGSLKDNLFHSIEKTRVLRHSHSSSLSSDMLLVTTSSEAKPDCKAYINFHLFGSNEGHVVMRRALEHNVNHS